MASGRKRRAGFTLTEMLMAAGILGIGLTMVASIFPVAVDQSRRSRDLTMAALCARSVMAQTRAGQNAIYNGLRGRTEEFLDLNSTVVYRPSVFLYTKARTYDGVGTWDAGNYVARIFAARSRSPLSAFPTDGPYRLAIVVCRSIGKPPPPSVTFSLWANADKPKPGPGTYVIERSRGCAWGHLLDYVKIDPAGDKTGYPAVGWTSSGAIISQDSNILCVPDAVAVYHTILGE